MKVVLVNVDGTRYDLSVINKRYIHSMEGLGYSSEMKYRRTKNRWKITEDKIAQVPIKGTIKFWGETARNEYQEFVNFCQMKPLYMIYELGTEEFRRNIVVSEVGLSDADALQCSVVLTPISLPYKVIKVMTKESNNGEGKKYNYCYPFMYRSTEVNNVVINSDSYLESPCKLVIYGPMTNPRWTHYVNNVEVANGRMVTNLPQGHRIEITTESIPYSILQYDDQDRLVADLYQASDFGTDRFIHLRYGENKIAVGDDGSNYVSLKAEGMIEYASV